MSFLYDRWPDLPAPVIWSREYTMWRWEKIQRRSDLATELYTAAGALCILGMIFFFIEVGRALF